MGTVERALRALIEEETGQTVKRAVRDLEDQVESMRTDVASVKDILAALTDHLESLGASDAFLNVKLARAGAKTSEGDYSPEAIKALRNKFDVTQKELAELLNVSPSTIAAWESDRTSPTAQNRTAIAALRETSQEEVYRALGKEGKARPLSASEILRIREEIGISQAKFARMLGVSTNTVGYWESGRTSPRSGSLAAIHEVAEKESIPTTPGDRWGGVEPVEMPEEPLTPDEIREIRTEVGLSQTEMADELDVSVNTVSNWENGHSYPRGRSLRRLIQMRESA